ncbi:MAG TPA: hypothetical protein VF395_05285 [Polyangiaceae bacterium]
MSKAAAHTKHRPSKTRSRGAPVRAHARATRAKKISLTVDEAVLRDVTRDAQRFGRTLSAHITDALARDVRRRRLQQLIEDYEAEHGSIGEDELAEVRAEWRG